VPTFAINTKNFMPPSRNVKKIIAFALLLLAVALVYKFANKSDTQGITLVNPEIITNGRYIILELDPQMGSEGRGVFSVTGWRLSSSGRNWIIGFASSLPLQGMINEEVPVVITRQSKLIISWDRSPIGVSFRENKCTGFLGTFQEFVPPLNPSLVTSTTTYAEYNVCVKEHREDSDFFSNAWRIYLADDEPLTPGKSVLLFDREGSLLDINYPK